MSDKTLFKKDFIFFGIVLGVIFSFLHFIIPVKYSIDAVAILVAACGGVYVGISLHADSVKKMLLQFSVGILFIVAAALGLWLNPLFFAIAFLSHGIWDIVTVHPKCLNFKIAGWYMPMCVGYDFVFAIYLFIWYASL